jgi:SAM-dependent methyltransferase
VPLRRKCWRGGLTFTQPSDRRRWRAWHRTVSVARSIQDLDKVEAYDGIWANACLLHVPRPDLAKILTLIWRALRPAGYFYASYKTGDVEGRDALNRYYNYPSPDWLRATYAAAGSWSSLSIETGEVTGFDNKPAAMLFVVARKAL